MKYTIFVSVKGTNPAHISYTGRFPPPDNDIEYNVIVGVLTNLAWNDEDCNDLNMIGKGITFLSSRIGAITTTRAICIPCIACDSYEEAEQLDGFVPLGIVTDAFNITEKDLLKCPV